MDYTFKNLIEKYKIKPIGVFHVGASVGQECKEYYDVGVKQTIWIEAIPNVFNTLQLNISEYPNAIAYNACISDIDEQIVTFNLADNGDSSSLLEFGTHKEEHPYVNFIGKLNLKTITLDTLINENEINLLNYNILNIDLQGAELLALKGLGEKVILFHAIMLEVNEKELYKGCALVGEIDEYLNKFGFIGVECQINEHGWGDKFYINKNNCIKPFNEFNEDSYLNANPDVRKAVIENQFKSGLHHYETYGKNEGRRW